MSDHLRSQHNHLGKGGHSTCIGKKGKTSQTVAAGRIWNSLPGRVRKSTYPQEKGLQNTELVLTKSFTVDPKHLTESSIRIHAMFTLQNRLGEGGISWKVETRQPCSVSIAKWLALSIEGSHTTG